MVSFYSIHIMGLHIGDEQSASSNQQPRQRSEIWNEPFRCSFTSTPSTTNYCLATISGLLIMSAIY